MKRSLLACAAVLGICAGAGQALADTLYTNSFDSGLDGFTTTGMLLTQNGQTYIGDLTQGATATLALNTSGYTDLKLSYTLYAVLSLDGNGPAGGNSPSNPDHMVVTDNGVSIFDYSFANYGGDTQSYGGAGVPAGDYAAGTGAASCGDLGMGCGAFGDRTYNFANLALSDTGLLTLQFNGLANQDAGDEYFGIDNVTITGTAVAPPISAVPEPASWAMMIGGVGVAGGAMRRRVKRVANGVAFA